MVRSFTKLLGSLVPEVKEAKAKAKARAKTPAQLEKEKIATERKNAKTWAEASKVTAVLAPLVAQYTKAMGENENNTSDDWEARANWKEIQDILQSRR